VQQPPYGISLLPEILIEITASKCFILLFENALCLRVYNFPCPYSCIPFFEISWFPGINFSVATCLNNPLSSNGLFRFCYYSGFRQCLPSRCLAKEHIRHNMYVLWWQCTQLYGVHRIHEQTSRTFHCKLVRQQNNTTDCGVHSDVGLMQLVISKVGILEHKQEHTPLRNGVLCSRLTCPSRLYTSSSHLVYVTCRAQHYFLNATCWIN
jgi:hypothetical protein